MKTLFLAWQDPADRCWYTVGRLTQENSTYRFVYTKGATLSNNFIPFGRMKDIESAYTSEELFPLFSNRILTESRPEYNDYIQWLNLENKEKNIFEMLALTGGVRGTDSLEVFPCPEPDESGEYEFDFFCHGLRHLPKEATERVNSLSAGDSLYVMLDVQNKFDRLALSLRTEDPAMMVGYCPRYLAEDFNIYLKENNPCLVKFSVLKVNPDAPAQMRLMCKMRAPLLKNCQPCSNEQYLSLAG